MTSPGYAPAPSGTSTSTKPSEDPPMTTPDSPLGGTVRISIDTALMIAAFDPARLKDHVKVPRAWWEKNPLGAAERKDGRMAVWPLGGRGGSYRARLGVELTEVERAYDRGASPAAPLETTSGEVFVGPIERLPGDGFGDRYPAIPDKGGLLPLPPGKYAVAVHVLDWRPEERFWNEENEPTEDAPPDFVVLVAPVEALPAAPAEVGALIDLLPQKKAKGAERVIPVQKIRGPIILEDEKPKSRRSGGGGGSSGPAARREPAAKREGPLKVAPGRPGELREGARVRHSTYGVGTVLFVRDGFPKVRVVFDDQTEYKVDRSELSVLS